MSLTTDEEEQLMMILADCLSNPGLLSAWERGFVNDLYKQYEELGSEMFVSGKMWRILRDCHELTQL